VAGLRQWTWLPGVRLRRVTADASDPAHSLLAAPSANNRRARTPSQRAQVAPLLDALVSGLREPRTHIVNFAITSLYRGSIRSGIAFRAVRLAQASRPLTLLRHICRSKFLALEGCKRASCGKIRDCSYSGDDRQVARVG